MATQCSQEAVLYFIRERGGRVKNGDLMDYFRATIPKDPALKQVAKEAFKSHVDSVAYVKEENGEKYVCLKRRFREWSCPADELADSRSGAPQGPSPGSGYGTDHAGGAKSQPDISDKLSEGVNGGTEPDLRAHMGNSNGGRSAEHRLKAADPSSQMSEESSQTDTAKEDGKENRARCAKLGRVSYSEDRDSISSTPKHNRKRVVEASADSSPRVRRSALPRNSADLPGRWKDCPRGESDYETAAATLEPLEHEWMMCASDGHWESLRRLLVREPALVARKDFVTGFTCLHWAAKLGKHELIVMLVNFAKEHQVSVNVNARSSTGYTPLHLAAMHNHLEVVKLLVGAFDADVEARDYNGRKACQYLKSDIAQNILDIVGACAEADDAGVGDASRWRLSRVIQSNFRPLRAQNHDDSDEDGGTTKQKSLRRKSSFSKMKPSLNRIRLRSQIVHSTSLFDRFEKVATEESPKLSRPKSNLFG